MEFTGSFWEMDGTDLIETIQTYRASCQANGWPITGGTTDGKLGGAVTLFAEGNSRLRLGAAAGYGFMPPVSVNYRVDIPQFSLFVSEGLKNSTVYIPVEIYLKYASKTGKFALSAGGGADYIQNKTEYTRELEGGRTTGVFRQKKAVPYLQGGGEFFFAKWISINLGVKYLFNAVLDDLTGNVTAYGADKGENQLVMGDYPPYGERFSYAKPPLAAGVRPFKYDYSGFRANASLRVYFK